LHTDLNLQAFLGLAEYVEENKRLLRAVLALGLWLGIGVVYG
jgi:hypothetical protein